MLCGSYLIKSLGVSTDDTRFLDATGNPLVEVTIIEWDKSPFDILRIGIDAKVA